MGDKSKIEWTDASWNPVTGCSHVSPGCAHCYAETLSLRMGWSKLPWTAQNASDNVVLHHHRLDLPYRWKQPRRIFVNSMSDLFHDQVPDGFITWVWLTMAHNPQHIFQILTKRPERMRSFVTRWADLSGEGGGRFGFHGVRGPEATRATHPSGRGQLFAAYLDELAKTSGGQPPPGRAWPTFDWMEGPRWWPTYPLSNVWLGVSAEDQRRADERIPLLTKTPARIRFVSAEPLLGPIDLASLWSNEGEGDRSLDWIIVGGESGPNFRTMDPDWARSLRNQCIHAGVAYFFKQHGGRTPKAGGRDLDGRTWDQMPA